jgi:hypothetical protein
MPEQMMFGAWVKRRRKALDLTQAELAARVGCALGTVRRIESDDLRPSCLEEGLMFPIDDYTPHGYLDIPAHTRALSPLGVLRSHGAGFRWHYPAHAGMYGGRRETYRAGFQVAVDGALDLAAFEHASCPYHSKNVVTFALRRGTADVQVTFHPAGEHALRAVIEVRGAVRISVLVEYTRLLAAQGEWGESGLTGRATDAGLLLQGFEDGDAFLLWASARATNLGMTPDAKVAREWIAGAAPALPEAGFVTVLGNRGDTVALHAVLSFEAAHPASPAMQERRGSAPPLPVWERGPGGEGSSLEIILARGRTEYEARERLATARHNGAAELASLLAEDTAFWAGAPRLEGDWPEHWRRGMVYDFETLRMMVKRPAGIYRHIWDAMQIQAPRVVLAEAAFDALLLGYADAELAQRLMLGTFADAPMPNVPCSREDGTYNMVAADGTVCGTAPSWGYPWLALAWLYDMRPDRSWLAAIYPRLSAYLEWWLAERRDGDGWLVYACSWESGQDDSPRFGAQPLGGGHPIRHVRPADLQAAFAHAAGVMDRFATALGYAHDQPKWRALAAEFAERAARLWATTRFADLDARAGDFTNVDDIMLLAPLALGLATETQRAASHAALQSLDAAALTWPMLAWTATEAAQASTLYATAAELAAAVCERAYGFWDARHHQPDRTLPGIACEYWPPNGRCGGEGYGWGAFTTHLVLHTLLGLTPAPDGVRLRPNLPLEWRTPGRRYGARLRYRGYALAIDLAPLSQTHLCVSANSQVFEIEWGQELVIGQGNTSS